VLRKEMSQDFGSGDPLSFIEAVHAATADPDVSGDPDDRTFRGKPTLDVERVNYQPAGPGAPWRALSRPTWRPDIRAAVISRTRINLHRKIVKHAAFTGQFRWRPCPTASSTRPTAPAHLPPH
jgi:hypothetical protein